MGAFQHVVIGRMNGSFANDPDSLRLILVKQLKEEPDVGQFEGIKALLVFILMKDVPVGVIPDPLYIIDVFNP